MTKVTAKLLAFAATLLMSLSLHAAQFDEGKHYNVLDLPKSDKSLVTEFFSFYCPHCFQFESLIQQLKQELPEGTALEKSHVSFMGGNMGSNMSKAYATMVSLNVEDTMVPVMFDRIHVKKQIPNNVEELRLIFTDNGIDGDKFDATFNGFAVDSMVRRFDQAFSETGLRGVPSVVVNGKYQVLTQDIDSFEKYTALVNYLLTL
ncbi:thiol:disulfide interchange protein DsbA/DsbL [Vibrio sp. RC27]